MRYQMSLPNRSEVSSPDAKRLESAFLEQVSRGEGCWTWEGRTVTGRPYGRYAKTAGDVHIDTTAHRFAAEWLTDEDVSEGNIVIQTCGNEKCVRPDHLQVCDDKQEAYTTMVTLGHVEGPALSKEQAQEVRWVLDTLGRVASRSAIRMQYGLGDNSRIKHRLKSAERAYGSLEPKEPDTPLDRFLTPRRREFARAKWLAQNTGFGHARIGELYDLPQRKISDLKHEYGGFSPNIPAIRPDWYEDGMPPPEEIPEKEVV